jgi:hypothetical protein
MGCFAMITLDLWCRACLVWCVKVHVAVGQYTVSSVLRKLEWEICYNASLCVLMRLITRTYRSPVHTCYL